MPIAQKAGNFLLNLLKGIGRQAVGKPLGLGQEIAGKLTGITPEEMDRRRQEQAQKGGLMSLLARASKAGSLTPEERKDPLIIPKAFAGQASFLVPAGKAVKGASTLQKLLAGAKVGAGVGGLSGFGASRPGEEISTTAGGIAVGGVLGVGFEGLKGFGRKFIKTKAPTITGTKLSKEVGFTKNLAKMKDVAKEVGITDKMRSMQKVETVDKSFNKFQDTIKGLLKNKKPVDEDTILFNLEKHYNNSNIDETLPATKRIITQALNKLDDARGDNLKLNSLKTFARKEMGNLFRKGGEQPTQKQEVWGSVYNAVKDSLDTVSPQIRDINSKQRVLFDLAEEFVPAAQKATERVGVKVPLTDLKAQLPFTKETALRGIGIGGKILASPVILPLKAAGKVAGVAGKGINALPAQLQNLLRNASIAGGAGQTEQPEQLHQEEVQPTEEIDMGGDVISQLTNQGVSPEIAQQFASRISSGGQQPQQANITGYSAQQLGQAYSQALQAGDKASATQLKSMYDLEAGFQKSQGGGKSLPAGELSKLAGQETAIALLPDLQASFDSSKSVFGPIQGSVRGLIPYDVTAQDAKSTITLVRQIIGKGLEGGVLRKEDENKYKNILPKLSDTQATVQKKIDLLERTLNKKYKTTIRTFEKGGFDPTSGESQENQVQQLLELLSSQGLNL